MAIRRPSQGAIGSSYMLGAAFAFALAGVLAVYCKGWLGVWQLVLVRSMVFVAILAPWAAVHLREAAGNDRRRLLGRGVAGTFMPLLQFYAFFQLPAAIAMVLARSVPIWVILISLFRPSERPSRRELFAVGVAVVGVILIYHPAKHADAGNQYVFGLLAGLGSSLAQAVGFILIRDLRRTDSPGVINLWLGLVGLVAALPFALPQSWPAVRWVWTDAIAIGFFMFCGQMFQTRALRRLSAALASTLSLVASVVFAAVLGLLLFGQQPSPRELVGLVIVIAAGALASFAAGSRLSEASDAL